MICRSVSRPAAYTCRVICFVHHVFGDGNALPSRPPTPHTHASSSVHPHIARRCMSDVVINPVFSLSRFSGRTIVSDVIRPPRLSASARSSAAASYVTPVIASPTRTRRFHADLRRNPHNEQSVFYQSRHLLAFVLKTWRFNSLVLSVLACSQSAVFNCEAVTVYICSCVFLSQAPPVAYSRRCDNQHRDDRFLRVGGKVPIDMLLE